MNTKLTPPDAKLLQAENAIAALIEHRARTWSHLQRPLRGRSGLDVLWHAARHFRRHPFWSGNGRCSVWLFPIRLLVGSGDSMPTSRRIGGTIT